MLPPKFKRSDPTGHYSVISHRTLVLIFVTGLIIALLIVDSLLLWLCDTVTLFYMTTVTGYFLSARFTYKSQHNFNVQRTECYMLHVCRPFSTFVKRGD
jgi:hypothetical protein